MYVTTLINLLTLVTGIADKEMGSVVTPYTEDEFKSVVDKVYNEISTFSKWAPALDKGASILKYGH